MAARHLSTPTPNTDGSYRGFSRGDAPAVVEELLPVSPWCPLGRRGGWQHACGRARLRSCCRCFHWPLPCCNLTTELIRMPMRPIVAVSGSSRITSCCRRLGTPGGWPRTRWLGNLFVVLVELAPFPPDMKCTVSGASGVMRSLTVVWRSPS